jgi:hypothetical protein
MKIIYLENEKRHIFESETGHMSTFLKERVTKEQAEVLFLAQLANEGITAPAVDETPVTPEPDTTPAPPVEPPVEPAQEDVTPTDTANA